MSHSSGLKVPKNVPLAPMTTVGIGGKARFFILAKNAEEAIQATIWAKNKKIAYKVFGGGSNLVITDDDLDCLVIRVLGGQVEIKDRQVEAEAGVLLSHLIRNATKQGLGGLESLAGIPGTVGGAIVGNAGAYGHSISQVIDRVEIWDGEKRRWLSNKDCQFDYRESLFKNRDYLVLRAIFRLSKGNPQRLKKIVQEILEKRKNKYPPGIKTMGCFFKNPLVKDASRKTLRLIDQSKIIDGKIPAGYLLEQVGAKGISVGNIQVAQFHANFLINKGKGEAHEVKELASILKQKVKEKFQVDLKPEVRYL